VKSGPQRAMTGYDQIVRIEKANANPVRSTATVQP
jgi:hypothetical protein